MDGTGINFSWGKLKKIEMIFIELFVGIGGFRYGFEKASKKFKSVWSNDWDKYAKAIYAKHWGKYSIDGRDIRAVKSSEIPDHNLLTAGFPCQSFSIAGKRQGFKDTRGTLFFDICRILQAKRPSYCLLENVKGLLSHDNGETFQTILESLAELGYDCQWQVLNSKDFGVPQNRERVFIIGHLREKPRPEVFPIIEELCDFTKRNSKGKGTVSYNISAGYSRRNARGTHLIQEGFIGSGSQSQRVYSDHGISAHIKAGGGGGGAKTGLYLVGNIVGMTESRTDESKEIRKSNRKTGKDWSPRRGKKLVERKDGLVGTVGSVQTPEQFVKDLDFPEEDLAIRRLTPLECERLQGFPDGWTDFGINGQKISDTQRYKCLGNAVITNVIKFLGKRLMEEIEKRK